AVRRTPDGAALAGLAEVPGAPAPVVARGEQVRRLLGVDDDVDEADVGAEVLDALPVRTAVPRPEQAALLVRRVERAERRDPGDVRVLRVDGDPADVLGRGQAGVRPGLAGVGRTIDAVAPVRAALVVRLTRAEPQHVAVRGRDREVAEGDRRLVLERRLERRPVVLGLPEAAGRGHHVPAGGLARVGLAVDDAAAEVHGAAV